MYFIYLIECNDGSIYTGVATNVERRVQEHKKGIGGRYTRSRGVTRLLYSEKSPSRSAALKREFEIKSWDRKKKLELVKIPARKSAKKLSARVTRR